MKLIQNETIWQHLYRLSDNEGNQLTVASTEDNDEVISFQMPLVGNRNLCIDADKADDLRYNVSELLINDFNIILPVYIQVCCTKPRKTPAAGSSLLAKRKATAEASRVNIHD